MSDPVVGTQFLHCPKCDESTPHAVHPSRPGEPNAAVCHVCGTSYEVRKLRYM